MSKSKKSVDGLVVDGDVRLAYEEMSGASLADAHEFLHLVASKRSGGVTVAVVRASIRAADVSRGRPLVSATMAQYAPEAVILLHSIAGADVLPVAELISLARRSIRAAGGVAKVGEFWQESGASDVDALARVLPTRPGRGTRKASATPKFGSVDELLAFTLAEFQKYEDITVTDTVTLTKLATVLGHIAKAVRKAA